ncbi:MAG: hypothetical protein OJF49_000684 [Ktedonobacterales bacterium]|nr:MAG: hypothetical protein OJF49_000684 [Ktedonobacterales bacterium]
MVARNGSASACDGRRLLAWWHVASVPCGGAGGKRYSKKGHEGMKWYSGG